MTSRRRNSSQGQGTNVQFKMRLIGHGELGSECDGQFKVIITSSRFKTKKVTSVRYVVNV